jgi:hypothetical protein
VNAGVTLTEPGRSLRTTNERVGKRAAQTRFRQAKRKRGVLRARRLDVVHCERERDASRDDRMPCQSGSAGPRRIDPWSGPGFADI